MKTLLLPLIIAATVCGSQEKVRYDNFQVHRLIPHNNDSLNLIKQLGRDYNLNFWKSAVAVNQSIDVMLPSHHTQSFVEALKNKNIYSTVIINNVQDLIDNERGVRQSSDFGWDDYHTLQEINVWLSNLADKYPNQVTLQKGGTSYEGRPIVGVHISFAPGNENRSIFLEANIHACEWISSAVATYILNELLTSEDPTVREIAESHDWYVFPVLNPDGYVYTHTTDRMWRKTRAPYGNCFGVDPNRNWDYHFNEGGSTDNPCDTVYAGPEPFSEPETRSYSEYLQTVGASLEAYFSFHSYAQILLLPYGYTPDHLDNYDELYAVGTKGLETLKQYYGTEYEIGDVAEILYVASGGSPDWVKGTFGTRITYTYELRDTGKNGFILPAAQIIPTGEETFASIITILQEFAKLE